MYKILRKTHLKMFKESQDKWQNYLLIMLTQETIFSENIEL